MTEFRQVMELQLQELRKEKEDSLKNAEKSNDTKINPDVDQKKARSTFKEWDLRSLQLNQTLEDIKSRLVYAQNKAELLQKQVDLYKLDCESSNKENITLKKKIKRKKDTLAEHIMQFNRLVEEINTLKRKEPKALKEIKYLQNKLRRIQTQVMTKNEIDRLCFEYKMLLSKCEALIGNSIEGEHKHSSECTRLQSELRKYDFILLENEYRVNVDKNDFQTLFVELNNIVQSNKEKTNALLNVNTKQLLEIERDKRIVGEQENEIEITKGVIGNLCNENNKLKEAILALTEEMINLQCELCSRPTDDKMLAQQYNHLEKELISGRKDLQIKAKQIQVKTNTMELQLAEINRLTTENSKALHRKEILENEFKGIDESLQAALNKLNETDREMVEQTQELKTVRTSKIGMFFNGISEAIMSPKSFTN